MTKEEARQKVYELFKQELKPDRSKKGYICPICGSGSGPNGTGMTENQKNPFHYTCWAGCFKNSDAFDIIALQNHLPIGSFQVFRDSYNKFGISADFLENDDLQGKKMSKKGVKNAPKRCTRPKFEPLYAVKMPFIVTPETTPHGGVFPDFSGKIRQAQEALPGSAGESYLRSRGISQATAAAYRLGFSPAEFFAADQQEHPAVILPSGSSFFTARNISGGARYANPKGGQATLFNGRALGNLQGRPVFLVEGALDALSILEAGGLAAALNSTGNLELFLSQVRERGRLPPVILCLDPDEAGEGAAAKIREALDAADVPHMDGHAILGGEHDANDALVADPARFRESVAAAEREALHIVPAASAEYRNLNAANCLRELVDEIARNADAPGIRTGFPSLDEAFGGGLYAGLYFLGAVSSAGKTTFALQLCDQVAAAGQDVLIFSMEMARKELMAKSVSRLTYQLAAAQGLGTWAAKSVRGILDGSRWKGYSGEEQLLIAESLERYAADIAPHVWIFESVGDFGTDDIRAAVQKHIRLTGNPPVCLIDYVQIMAPSDLRATDKQNTDIAVRELKRISRDFSIPVIGISSLNRESYAEPISTRAFKESGAIEYGCDMLLGLQYAGMEYLPDENEKDRRIRIRELTEANERAAAEGQGVRMQLKALKQRSGKRGVSVDFTYFPKFNVFLDGQGGLAGFDGDETPIFG